MKKIISKILFGIPAGICIGFVIALTFSFVYQSQNFVPSAPRFVGHFSSNTLATAVSLIFWACMGIVFSISGMTFEKDEWSITRQTIVHFAITYIGFTPLAILAGWFPLNIFWMISYTLIYLIVYVIIWFVSMLIAKEKIEELNKIIKNNKSAKQFK
ncbi:membrane protein [Oenococcus oeni IOEB_0501]|uniref:DUF3021 domain-containing protein n=1 Tax=Oenococcus oeni TaxID=1247 RepID=UPI0004ABEFB8|nr:DUF3021 domain-containing protein [Oenococcus oeni]KEP86965.1 membrane protein [Oenococcus oeni IOEB_0501]KGH63492.1 membrane protein [Oenococcus oeni S13]